MANITIKNVPDALYEQLKRSASSNRRSINNEAIVCLERALISPHRDEADLLDRIRTLRSQSSIFLDENQLKAAIREGRA